MLRTRWAMIGVASALTLTVTGCGGDGGGDSTSSSTTAADQAASEEHAVAEVERIDPLFRERPAGTPIPDDAPWASDKFRTGYNKSVADLKKQGITSKGKVTVTSTHLADSDPEAAGGWDLSMYVCSETTVRRYDKNGKDVTGDPEDPSRLLPKGPHPIVNLVSYVTPDDGQTWQIDRAQLLTGKDAEESPCAKG